MSLSIGIRDNDCILMACDSRGVVEYKNKFYIVTDSSEKIRHIKGKLIFGCGAGGFMESVFLQYELASNTDLDTLRNIMVREKYSMLMYLDGMDTESRLKEERETIETNFVVATFELGIPWFFKMDYQDDFDIVPADLSCRFYTAGVKSDKAMAHCSMFVDKCGIEGDTDFDIIQHWRKDNYSGFIEMLSNTYSTLSDETIGGNLTVYKLHSDNEVEIMQQTPIKGKKKLKYAKYLPKKVQQELNIHCYHNMLGEMTTGLRSKGNHALADEVEKLVNKIDTGEPFTALELDFINRNTGADITNELIGHVPQGGKSQFAQTVINSKNTAPELSKQLDELDLGYDKVTNEQSLLQANKRIAEDTESAVKYVLDTKAPSAEHTATAIQLINKFQKEGNFERAVDIASDISSKLTKNGQAIQAASMYDRLSPEGILLYAQRHINKLNDERWFKGLTKEQKLNPDIAKRLQELSENMKGLTGDAKIEASQELQSALQALGKSNLFRQLESAQSIGQLLNPRTLIRNTVGNEIFYRVERINKYISTPIDIARSFLTGAERTVTFKTNQSAWGRFFKGLDQGGVTEGVKQALHSPYLEGLVKGAKAGWKGTNPMGLTSQFDLTAPAFSGKWNPLTYMEKALGATLKGFDFAAYTRAVRETVGEMAELSAINKGLKGPAKDFHVQNFMRNADKNILDIADQYGKYVTFQDENVLSKGLSAVKRGANLGKEFGFGSLIVKYPKTPGALIMRGLEYSPAGFLKSAYEVAKPILKGGVINNREVTMSLSRAITGTLGFTGLGYYLADKGVITGRTDKDKDVRDLQKEIGGGSYKVNISALVRWAKSGFNPDSLKIQLGDTMYSYDWIQPIAMAVSFGANINTNIKENKNPTDNLGATMASSLEGALGTIAEQPVLQGITRQFQGYDLGQNITQTLKGIPSSFTPTLLNQVRQATDNTGRSTYNPNPLQEALNLSKVKVPGLSGGLPQNFNTLGLPKQNFQNGSNNLFNVFANPGFVTKYAPNEIQKEVLRLYENTGEKKQFPRVIADKITYTRNKLPQSYTLSQEEKPLYQKLVGELTSKYITNTINGSGYTGSDEHKVDLVYNAINRATEEAKRQFLRSKGLQ